MKTITKTLAILAFILVAANAQKWVLQWSDEFDGPNIDSNKWWFQTGNGQGGWGNNELEYYTDRNAWIQDGNLIIQANQENYEGFQYTSSKLVTKGKFSTVYGKFEVRAKLPSGQGMWPAFWLLGDNIDQVGWPACGEIDIMEAVGKDPNNNHGSLHAPGFDITGSYNIPNGVSSDFHVYGVNWQPDNIQFYVDDNVYATFTADQARAQGGEWVFNGKNMWMILNLAVGGNWPGAPDGSTQFPQQLVVDYVKVWQADWGFLV